MGLTCYVGGSTDDKFAPPHVTLPSQLVWVEKDDDRLLELHV